MNVKSLGRLGAVAIACCLLSICLAYLAGNQCSSTTVEYGDVHLDEAFIVVTSATRNGFVTEFDCVDISENHAYRGKAYHCVWQRAERPEMAIEVGGLYYISSDSSIEENKRNYICSIEAFKNPVEGDLDANNESHQ